jgi:hypothetical protein
MNVVVVMHSLIQLVRHSFDGGELLSSCSTDALVFPYLGIRSHRPWGGFLVCRNTSATAAGV